MVLLAGTIGTTRAAPAPQAVAENLELGAALEALVEAEVRANDFSGSVLVARGDELLLAAGYGLADREHGVPCRPETKYRIGSVTKQFVGAAVMKLVEAGEVDVRDRLELFLPELPKTWQKLRVHHLLCHESGLWNVTNDGDYMTWARLPTRPAETLERAFEKPLEFEPGSRFSYSNTGYLVLALVIEEASGELYEDFLRTALFEPAGMPDTGHDRNELVLAHRASGYERVEGEVQNAPFHDMEVPIGGGDLYTTVLDLWAWKRALFEGDVLTESSREALLTRNRGGYGYGVMIGEHAGHTVVQHGGGIFGFVSHLAHYPAENGGEGLTVVVLSNAGWSDPQGLARALAEEALSAVRIETVSGE